MFNITYNACKLNTNFWLVELENDSQAELIASRSMTIFCILRHIYSEHSEPSLHAKTIANFHKGFKMFLETESDDNREHLQNYFRENSTFRITVEIRNKKLSLKQKIQKIEDMSYLPIKGKFYFNGS